MSKLIYRINLNKSSNRLDQYEVQQRRRRAVALGFFFFILVGVTAAAVFFTLQTQKKITAYQAELNQIEQDIASLSASSQYLSPDDIFALAELANKRMTWTEKFNVLGRILPKDVAITELYYDYQIKILRLKGVSRVNPQLKDLDLVVSIVDLMKGNQDFAKGFADIRFTSSTRIKREEQEIVEFEIECLIG